MPLADLLAIDLDFTLLDAGRRIPPENLDAIGRATEGGISVVLASGRMAGNMRTFVEELGLTTPVVSCNGAYVVNRDGSVIKEHTVKRELAEALVRYCKGAGLHLNLYANNRVYFPEENEWSNLYLSRVRDCEPRVVGWDGLYGLDAHKLIIVAAADRMQDIHAETEQLFPRRSVAITFSEPEYLEFLDPRCSKATGLAAVARALRIPQSRTAAIGDFLNDISMLEWAGRSAAVANALPQVQAAADLVVPAYDAGGVAAYVDVLLQNEGECSANAIRQ